MAIDPINATDNAERCARPVQKRIREGGSYGSSSLQVGSSPLRSHNRNIQRLPQEFEKDREQALGDEADKIIKMFLFGKLPVEIQQELTMANKEESSPEEIKTYLMRKYQYQQYAAPPTTIQPFNAVTSSVPPKQSVNQTPSQKHDDQ